MPARKIARVGAWCSGCRRCFLQWMDHTKATPMVGLPARNVAKKFGRKSFPEKFSGSQGDPMAVEDSEDEGWVVGV